MSQTNITDQATNYENWYRKYPYAFLSQIEAISELIPKNNHKEGIEICLRTGMYAEALGIEEGTEAVPEFREMATRKGIKVHDAVPEKLPYKRNRFDYILIAHTSALQDIHKTIKEAKRVLKPEGALIIAFINKNSYLGRLYQTTNINGRFRKKEKYYSVERIVNEIKRTGFKNIKILQTLFRDLNNITTVEKPRHGYGDGSYIVTRAIKR